MATATTKNVKKLTSQLSSVAAQAKAKGINTAKADSMIAQTKAEGSKAYKGSSFEKDYNNSVITADNLKNTPVLTVPTNIAPAPAPDVTAGNVGISGGTTGITSTPTGLTVDPIAQQAVNSNQARFDKMLADITGAAEDRTTGADIQRKVESDSGIAQYRQQVNDASSQINNIIAARDAQNQSFVGQGRGVTEAIIGGQQEQTNREAYIKAAPIQALLANAQGNLDTAKEYINTWGRILMDDANTAYTNKVKKIEAVYDFGTAQDKIKFDSLREQAKEKKDTAVALATAKTEAIKQALGQNAPQSVISAITNATDLTSVATATGIYNGDVLGQQLKRAQLSEINSKIQANIEAGKPIVVASDPTKSDVENNIGTLGSILGSSKVTAGNKTAIGNGLSLLKAAQDLAKANSGGKFTGQYPGRGVVDFFTPEAFRRQKTVENDALISALDLQTQFWASGAALSDAQTKLVQKFIPTKSDTDATIKTKTNNLVNYMLSQTSAKLLTDGVQYNPSKVDLYKPQLLDATDGAGVDDIFGSTATSNSTSPFNADEWLK